MLISMESQERPAAAVEHAADDLDLRIVVRSARVLVQVEAGVTAGTLLEEAVSRSPAPGGTGFQGTTDEPAGRE